MHVTFVDYLLLFYHILNADKMLSCGKIIVATSSDNFNSFNKNMTRT